MAFRPTGRDSTFAIVVPDVLGTRYLVQDQCDARVCLGTGMPTPRGHWEVIAGFRIMLRGTCAR